MTSIISGTFKYGADDEKYTALNYENIKAIVEEKSSIDFIMIDAGEKVVYSYPTKDSKRLFGNIMYLLGVERPVIDLDMLMKGE